MRARDRSRAQILQSLDLALRVLGSFGGERRERGVTEVARDSGVSKTTIYRLLATLEGRRYVTQNPVTGRYCLGPVLGRSPGRLVHISILLQKQAPTWKNYAGVPRSWTSGREYESVPENPSASAGNVALAEADEQEGL